MSDSIGGLAMKRGGGNKCCGQLTTTKKTRSVFVVVDEIEHHRRHCICISASAADRIVCLPLFSLLFLCALLCSPRLVAISIWLQFETRHKVFALSLSPFFFTSQTPNGSSDEGRETERKKDSVVAI